MIELAALIAQCTSGVAPATLRAIVEVESAGDPYAIHVNAAGITPPRAKTYAEAVRVARALLAGGHSIDLGLMQINSANLGWLGLDVGQVLEPCTNLAAGAAILKSAYAAAVLQYGEGRQALRAALSAYNTGDFHTGLQNGYVARYGLEDAPDPHAADTRMTFHTTDTGVMTMPTIPNHPTLDDRLRDLDIPGTEVELGPDEADVLGAFQETALTEDEARESAIDLDWD